VLLAVTIRPLLSHKRENAAAVAGLRDVLRIYGAGGWKDTDDLGVGQRTEDGVRRAILEETGGLIWWGTRPALSSRFINTVEIPTALDRKEAEPLYPVVPLFIDLNPSLEADRAAVRSALGQKADDFLDCNGLIRRRGEPVAKFNGRVARRYVADAVKALATGRDNRGDLSIAMRALSEPGGAHDLTFDWRTLINPRSRRLRPEALDLMVDALANARQAFQGAFLAPRLVLDLDLPLPLAFLVGHEWRVTTRLQMAVRQRTGVSSRTIESDDEVTDPAEVIHQPLGREGPVVVAVSCQDGFGEAAIHYAALVDACELVTLHKPGQLTDAELRGLGRQCARELRSLNNRGLDKHLLMLGPVALAVFAGVAANASGRTTMPFWNGTEYVTPVIVGAAAFSGSRHLT